MALLLDTSMLIDAERKGVLVAEEDEAVLPATAVMEYMKGVERAESGARREKRLEFLETIFERAEVLPFTGATAKIAARIWADLVRAGTPLSNEDIQIAATAIEHDLKLATLNVKDFARIEGLQLAGG
jgi:predicted nucleic acid-binding protein